MLLGHAEASRAIQRGARPAISAPLNRVHWCYADHQRFEGGRAADSIAAYGSGSTLIDLAAVMVSTEFTRIS
jgi:hypothetical protein